jgi:predicted unusual protein kinase regulating ubiquinone biosynthesis (AarF/ABC1/UbiB family)
MSTFSGLFRTALEETMGRQGSNFLPSALRLGILLAGIVMAMAAFATTSTSTKTTTKSAKGLASSVTNNTTTEGRMASEDEKQQATKRSSSFLPFSSCSSSSSSHNNNNRRGRDEPSFLQKQRRRWTVFTTAAQVFVEYKWAQRHARLLKAKLHLNPEDPSSEDHEELVAYWSSVHARNANMLLHKIQQLEGFWVKVGQYLSSRADVMPPEYLQTLAQLQDSMPPRSWQDTWQTIQEELGGGGDDEDTSSSSSSLLEQLETIDPIPLSTASLAQVHKATLKNPPHHAVVLKVQHRGVASLMLQDMENLRIILEWLAKTDSDLDFGPVIREYNHEVRKELDFRIEAQNMHDVSKMLQEATITAIIPEIIPGFVTKRVLVMDFAPGFPIRDTDKLQEYHVDRELLLERVCAAWAVQMHVGGVFNADPHMGKCLNLLHMCVCVCVCVKRLGGVQY